MISGALEVRSQVPVVEPSLLEMIYCNVASNGCNAIHDNLSESHFPRARHVGPRGLWTVNVEVCLDH
jgi:hypothetical protein